MRFLGRFLLNLLAVSAIVATTCLGVLAAFMLYEMVGGWLGEYAWPLALITLLLVMVAGMITIAELDNPDEEE